MLVPYAPADLDAHRAAYRDKKNPPAWFGMDVWGATICFNTVEAQKSNIPKPETWKDLTKPVYKGQIVMPNPASSGTGFFDVTAWLQLWGEAEGRRLEVHGRAAREHRAVHALGLQALAPWRRPASTWSASRSSTAANSNKAKGAPIDLVFPKEGLGWDLEAFAIHKGTKKLDAAKKLADWAVEQGRDGAVRQELRDHRPAGAFAAACRTCRPTTRAAWSRSTSPGRRRTATASSPSGASATTPRQSRSRVAPDARGASNGRPEVAAPRGVLVYLG